MFITGVGIGPTFSVLHDRGPERVPFERLGVATGNLTFFRQIGGSVGLAVVGTLFAQNFDSLLQPQLVTAGVPAPVATQSPRQATSGSGINVTQVGGSLAERSPGAATGSSPLISNIVTGIHRLSRSRSRARSGSGWAPR